MDITAASRLRMWASSCASTASSSSSSSVSRSPDVTTTVECSRDRPVAKAFGADDSAMATSGGGTSAVAASRFTRACNSGASSSSTTRAFVASSAIRSPVTQARTIPASVSARTTTGFTWTVPSWASVIDSASGKMT